MNVGISDKLLMPWLKGKEYMDCANEGEAIAIAGGYWLATNKRATVFASADGFCNQLNFLTSWVIPQEIEMNLIISTGRTEPPHKVMTDILPDLLKIIPFDTKRISLEVVRG